MILLKLQASMKEAPFEVLKRCRKSYEISQIFAEAPQIVDSLFDAPELVSNSPGRRARSGQARHARRAQGDRQDRRWAEVSQLARFRANRIPVRSKKTRFPA